MDFTIKPANANELERFLAACIADYGCSLSVVSESDYGMVATPGGVEVYEDVERKDYRREVFPDVKTACDGFIVDGHPLSHYFGTLAASKFCD